MVHQLVQDVMGRVVANADDEQEVTRIVQSRASMHCRNALHRMLVVYRASGGSLCALYPRIRTEAVRNATDEVYHVISLVITLALYLQTCYHTLLLEPEEEPVEEPVAKRTRLAMSPR